MAKKEFFKKGDDKKKTVRKKRRSPIKFIREVISELKKVTWPTRKEVIAYTGAVLAFVAIFAVMLGVIDYGLAEVLNLLVQ